MTAAQIRTVLRYVHRFPYTVEVAVRALGKGLRHPKLAVIAMERFLATGDSAGISPAVICNGPVEPSPQKTVVVLGSYRGGTSVVGGVLRLLGVFMGYRLGRGNNEDIEFQTDVVDEIKQHVAERNKHFDIWGWKYPGSMSYVTHLAPYLRNPHFIVVFRDPVAVAQKEVDVGTGSFRQMFQYAIEQENALIDFVCKNDKSPMLLLTYERLLHRPEEFVSRLADFLGIRLTSENKRIFAGFVQKGRRGRLSVQGFCKRAGLEMVIEQEKKWGVRQLKGGWSGLS